MIKMSQKFHSKIVKTVFKFRRNSLQKLKKNFIENSYNCIEETARFSIHTAEFNIYPAIDITPVIKDIISYNLEAMIDYHLFIDKAKMNITEILQKINFPPMQPNTTKHEIKDSTTVQFFG